MFRVIVDLKFIDSCLCISSAILIFTISNYAKLKVDNIFEEL